MDKIYENKGFAFYRFVCDCKSQGHSMDISVEWLNPEESEVVVNLYMAGKPNLSYRLKQAWKSLKGKDGQLADFCVRQEDIPHIIGVLKGALPRHTSGT